MTGQPAISRELTTATDAVIMRAMAALEAAGADLDGQGASPHALVMPGKDLRAVNAALAEWNLVACGQDSCDSWTHPIAQSAQQVFQATDQLFEQSRNLSDISDDARVPFLVSGTQVSRLADLGHHWAQVSRQRPRCGMR